MGLKKLYNDNLRKLPNEYRDVSVMVKEIGNKILSTFLLYTNSNMFDFSKQT